jgi:hypothetical protein
MTPEERDYQEALRRVQEAERTEAVEVDLSGLLHLTRLPLEELKQLNPLQGLNLSGCRQLSAMSPLAELTGLQSLSLEWCSVASAPVWEQECVLKANAGIIAATGCQCD